MIFYQLAFKKVIDYLQIGKPTKEQERLRILMHKKPKVDYEIKLNTDKTLNFYVSVLLSIIGILINLSLPFALLESPSEILKEKEYHIFYEMAKITERNSDILDFFIIIFIIMLIYAATKTILDAIKRTNINISPWIQRGKYSLKPVVVVMTDEDRYEELLNRRYRRH